MLSANMRMVKNKDAKSGYNLLITWLEEAKEVRNWHEILQVQYYFSQSCEDSSVRKPHSEKSMPAM